MPIRPFRASLATTDEVEICPAGAVINGINITGVPTGVVPLLRLGNNQRVELPSGPSTLTFGPGAAEEDVTEGAYLSVASPVPGASVVGFVSYRQSTERYRAGGGIVNQG